MLSRSAPERAGAWHSISTSGPAPEFGAIQAAGFRRILLRKFFKATDSKGHGRPDPLNRHKGRRCQSTRVGSVCSRHGALCRKHGLPTSALPCCFYSNLATNSQYLRNTPCATQADEGKCCVVTGLYIHKRIRTQGKILTCSRAIVRASLASIHFFSLLPCLIAPPW